MKNTKNSLKVAALLLLTTSYSTVFSAAGGSGGGFDGSPVGREPSMGAAARVVEGPRAVAPGAAPAPEVAPAPVVGEVSEDALIAHKLQRAMGQKAPLHADLDKAVSSAVGHIRTKSADLSVQAEAAREEEKKVARLQAEVAVHQERTKAREDEIRRQKDLAISRSEMLTESRESNVKQKEAHRGQLKDSEKRVVEANAQLKAAIAAHDAAKRSVAELTADLGRLDSEFSALAAAVASATAEKEHRASIMESIRAALAKPH
ncbi:MAG: hypothetical protein WCJ92_07415 [Alphaproteobacteria bacterium]